MKSSTLNTLSVSEIANQIPGAVNILEKYKIDYCCHGKENFSEACRNAKVDEVKVQQELDSAAMEPRSSSLRIQDWPLDLLIHYIIENHHRYVKYAIPDIRLLINKVAAKHGVRHPGLVKIREQFQIMAEELEKHMYKEEAILFPAVVNLARQVNDQHTRDDGFRLMYPIEVMEDEHERAGKCLVKIREASAGYNPPPDACNSFKLLYHKLEEFEVDLHAHIHLENNILFPKALELEKKFNGPVSSH